MEDLLDSGEKHECATCGHEWLKDEGERIVLDANGTQLQDGDSITVIKGLKVKGGAADIKVGTKIKGIRLIDGDHEIDCKVDGVPLLVKAMFVKKA